MGNNTSSPQNADGDALRAMDSSEFEPVEKPESPTNNNPNDLSYSGVLVEPIASSSVTSTYAAPVGRSQTTGDAAAAAAATSKRRIVKAMPPTPRGSPKEGEVRAGSTTTFTSTNQDDAGIMKKQHGSSSTVLVSNSNDAELLEESLEMNRKQRLDHLAKEQKSKRDKVLQERRKNVNHRKSTASANPFSRFLSAFSVENKHKRAYEDGADQAEYFNQEELAALDPKRLKRSDTDPNTATKNASDDDDDDKKSMWYGASTWPWAATTAAAAILLLVVYRRKK